MQEQVEGDLTFVGLVGLVDRPRPEVKRSITACQSAGVRPIMITGDHPLTIKAIACEVGRSADDSAQGRRMEYTVF